MSRVRTVISWLGVTSPKWMHVAIAQRNIPIITVGSIVVALFAGMLAFCLLTGVPCPVDGFDEASHETPGTAQRYLAVALVDIVVLVGMFVYGLMYIRRKWRHPRAVAVLSAVFALLMAALWGIAESGVSPAQQVLIFASIQFLAAGLLVFDPLVSILYFTISFFLFGFMLDGSGQMMPKDRSNLVYLAVLDIIVSWVVYSLFVRGAVREQEISEESRRDELTGAKNRHYLREDFPLYRGVMLFVMLCDVDNFKHYNDCYGHDTGDRLLREFFFALREAFGDEATYRYGGDEFLVVAAGFDNAEFNRGLRAINQQLEHMSVGDEKGGITYSGGYVCGPVEDDASFREMLHKADARLLEAKRAGKNRVIGE